MKKYNAFLLAALGASSLSAAKLEQVIVRQQWPWSTDVKIEYKLSGVTTPVDIAVKAYNGDVELDQSKVASALIGDRYGISEDGVGTIVLDPVKAFGTEKVALANFKVKLSLSDSAENINEVIYKVFDLASGTCTDVRRADLFDGKYGTYETDYKAICSDFPLTLSDTVIWTGVTNDVAYKTAKLVMRKIPAKDVVWTMGTPSDQLPDANFPEVQRKVKLTADYYIGVFEITQGQFYRLYSKSGIPSEEDAVKPKLKLMYGGSGDKQSVKDIVALLSGKLSLPAGWSVDLPTAAEWEFACRAGTTKCLYTEKNVNHGAWWSSGDVNVANLAWYSTNSGNVAQPVGLKWANAYGLYDMIGNAFEMVSDIYGTKDQLIASFGPDYKEGDVLENPKGPTKATSPSLDTTFNVLRGGSYSHLAAYTRAGTSFKSSQNWSTTSAFQGCRVMLRMPAEN